MKLFEVIVDELLQGLDPTVRIEEDARDVLEKQRTSQLEQGHAATEEEEGNTPTNDFPASLTRRFEVRRLFKSLP